VVAGTAFSPDGTQLFVSVGAPDYSGARLYYSTRVNDEWTPVVAAPFVSDFIYSNEPVFSADGKTLTFTGKKSTEPQAGESAVLLVICQSISTDKRQTIRGGSRRIYSGDMGDSLFRRHRFERANARHELHFIDAVDACASRSSRSEVGICLQAPPGPRTRNSTPSARTSSLLRRMRGFMSSVTSALDESRQPPPPG
jgi:WD40-like Beta Propeller Repeat